MSDQIKVRDPFFSRSHINLIRNPFHRDNPITIQALGVCSALAVTAKLKPALMLSLSVIVVIVASNVIIAALRQTIAPRIRIIVQLTVIAMMVILVDQVLKAFSYEVSKQLSIFVGLIITNCIIMGRLEAFAMGNRVVPAFWDGLGNGIGYSWILIAVGFFRELLGSGTLLDYPVIEKLGLYQIGYVNNGFMILPPMALITVGLIIWWQRSRFTELVDKS